MIKLIKTLIYKLYTNKIIRYVFFGGLTTLVNLITYSVLRIYIDYNIANFISIILAILFAYFVNSRFVFESNTSNFKEKLNEFVKFIGARASTMLIEIVGVFALVDLIGIDDMVSKLIIQIVVLVLNYIFSKLIVFKKSGPTT